MLPNSTKIPHVCPFLFKSFGISRVKYFNFNNDVMIMAACLDR